jgi:hypothetical protein
MITSIALKRSHLPPPLFVVSGVGFVAFLKSL